MKFCPNCTKRNDDNAKFCFNCGLNFGKHENEKSGRTTYCIKCGVKLVPNASFCTQCGTVIKKEAPMPIIDVISNDGEKASLCLNDNKGKTPEEIYEEQGFIVEKGVLIKYIGRDKSVAIPDGISKIGEGAFYHCTSIENVVIPSTVKVMENGVFKDCSNLKIVRICDGIKEIPKETFYNCDKLEKVDIPSTVTKIGCSAFSLCRGLISFEIPKTVTQIDRAFSNCRNLKTIKVPIKCKCENDWLYGTPADIIYY